MKLLLTAALLSISALMLANDFAWATDKLGYTGSVSTFATLNDAQTGANSTGTYAVAQRDAGTYLVNNRPDVDTNYSIFLTAWYYTTSDNTNGKTKGDPLGDRYYSGWGNPNNTDASFAQLYDKGSVKTTAMTGGWTSSAYDTFSVHMAGANATYADATSRFWNAGRPDIGGEGTRGTWVSYALDLTATGLSGAASGGYVTATNQPGAVSGTFKAIFQNQSANDPLSNGFYAVNLSFNDTNWAYANSANLNGPFNDSYFSAGAVPEPASMLAIGGLLGLLAKKRKKS